MGPLWRQQENVAKHGVRLRGDALQMPYVPNGMKGYTTTTTK
jgi:hypothetical protein